MFSSLDAGTINKPPGLDVLPVVLMMCSHRPGLVPTGSYYSDSVMPQWPSLLSFCSVTHYNLGKQMMMMIDNYLYRASFWNTSHILWTDTLSIRLSITVPVVLSSEHCTCLQAKH